MKHDRRLQAWWEEEFARTDGEIDPALRDRMFARVRRETTGKGRPANTLRLRVLRWAAVICLPLLLAGVGYYLGSTLPTGGTTFTVKADRGDKAQVELPDGTSIVLNSGSQLSYGSDFGRHERRVWLSGEGYFEVARDERHTFVVSAGGLEVKVLGTVFNLSAYEDEDQVEVVLLEGKVSVFAPDGPHTLQPGDKLSYDKQTRVLNTAKVHSADYVEWTQGNLYFERESLRHIMQRLSRIYNVDIRFASDSLPDEYFTGTIPGNDLLNALNILTLGTNLTYEMQGSTIVWKEK